MISPLGCIVVATVVVLLREAAVVVGEYHYSNWTLSSLDGNVHVTVFLPAGIIHDDENAHTYYESTRFDHGSMIGSIVIRKRKSRVVQNSTEAGDKTIDLLQQELLFGTGLWKVPHDSHGPESGVGLAGEFGFGENGATCNSECGWFGEKDVTNGLLGYDDADLSTFLKIGVGELVKSSCPDCELDDDYKFNSPYQFAKIPVWRLQSSSSQQIVLEHEAHLGHVYGYRLVRSIQLRQHNGVDELSVSTSLTNLGSAPFSTPWYSHNFFSCNDIPIGPGYQMELGLTTGGLNGVPSYREAGVSLSGWAEPLNDYAKVKSLPNGRALSIALDHPLSPTTKIKAEFEKDEQSTGTFTLRCLKSALHMDIPEVSMERPPRALSMYAFNVYMEQGAMCPEPQLLIQLDVGSSTSWTQRVAISDPSMLSVGDKGALSPSLELFTTQRIVVVTIGMLLLVSVWRAFCNPKSRTQGGTNTRSLI